MKTKIRLVAKEAFSSEVYYLDLGLSLALRKLRLWLKVSFLFGLIEILVLKFTEVSVAASGSSQIKSAFAGGIVSLVFGSWFFATILYLSVEVARNADGRIFRALGFSLLILPKMALMFLAVLVFFWMTAGFGPAFLPLAFLISLVIWTPAYEVVNEVLISISKGRLPESLSESFPRLDDPLDVFSSTDEVDKTSPIRRDVKSKEIDLVYGFSSEMPSLLKSVRFSLKHLSLTVYSSWILSISFFFPVALFYSFGISGETFLGGALYSVFAGFLLAMSLGTIIFAFLGVHHREFGCSNGMRQGIVFALFEDSSEPNLRVFRRDFASAGLVLLTLFSFWGASQQQGGLPSPPPSAAINAIGIEVHDDVVTVKVLLSDPHMDLSWFNPTSFVLVDRSHVVDPDDTSGASNATPDITSLQEIDISPGNQQLISPRGVGLGDASGYPLGAGESFDFRSVHELKVFLTFRDSLVAGNPGKYYLGYKVSAKRVFLIADLRVFLPSVPSLN